MRMNASLTGYRASSTDRPTLAARGCTCISNGKPAHGGVAMQPHQVRSVVRWPARAIGESAVARNTRPVRPGQLAIACPSRLRRGRSCLVERPLTLTAMRRRFWQVPVLRHRVRAAGAKGNHALLPGVPESPARLPVAEPEGRNVPVPWFDGQAAEKSPTSERSALLVSLQGAGG
jgi:hypothetical protein